MTITELIQTLQTVQNQHGDLPILIKDSYSKAYAPPLATRVENVDPIEFRKFIKTFTIHY